MPKKLSFPVAIIALLMIISTASAGFWIYSRTVDVSFSYDLSFNEVNRTSSSITFEAHLIRYDTISGQPLPVGNAEIWFFMKNFTASDFGVPIDSAMTEISGEKFGTATYTYQIPDNGTYSFRAGYNP